MKIVKCGCQGLAVCVFLVNSPLVVKRWLMRSSTYILKTDQFKKIISKQVRIICTLYNSGGKV